MAVDDGWSDDHRERFIRACPHGTISYSDTRAWTVSWIAEDLLSDENAATKVWKNLQPILAALGTYATQ
jgi:hypothetical protein